MTVSYSAICERLYAITAIATLSKSCKIALLHPDHADALRLMVRDALSALLSSLPKGIIEKSVYTDEEAVITFFRQPDDAEAVRAAILSAVASFTLAQAKIAASDSPETILRLAALLPSYAAGIVNALTPKAGSARISRNPVF